MAETKRIIYVHKWLYLVATLAVGLIAGWINGLLYGALKNEIPHPVLIAMMFTIFAALIGLTIFAMGRLCEGSGRSRGLYDSFADVLDGNGMLFAGLAVALVVLFLVTMLFEWLYEIENREELQTSSYIFVLDESSSMLSSDSSLQRYDAVNQVMRAEGADLPYAVYLFASNCIRIQDMGTYAGETLTRPAEAGRMMDGTEILNALNTVYADLSSGALQGGAHPQVILLTDGGARALNQQDLDFLAQCKTAGICVSAIGLGPANTNLLNQITSATGGITMKVDTAADLAEGFYAVSILANQRDLLSARRNVSGDGLYMVMRLAMLIVLGALIALIKLIALGDEWHMESLVVSGIGLLLGALLIEFGIRSGLNANLCRMLYWVLLALMFWSKQGNWGGQGKVESKYLSKQEEKKGSAFSWQDLIPGKKGGRSGGRPVTPKKGRGGNHFNEF